MQGASSIDLWNEVKRDLEDAARNWESVSYQQHTPEDRLANFVIANEEKYAQEGIMISRAGINNEMVILNWV